MTLEQLYQQWLDHYGPQGWWPVKSSTRGVNASGYHPGDYSFPRNSRERLEILLGAILTQNTSWRNVSMVMQSLIEEGILHHQRLQEFSSQELAEKIRSAGYHNQKARKIGILLEFLKQQGYPGEKTPPREELLNLWGIGPETADSMRLYAYGEKEMVIDLYTRRILTRLGFQVEKDSYESWKDFCIGHLPEELEVYQEFHGLVLAHAKACCGSRPHCARCFLKKSCQYESKGI